MNAGRAGWLATAGLLFWAGIAPAATFSLSGPAQMGNAIAVPAGATFTVQVRMNAPEIGNTFEVFLGFDRSSATGYGLTGSPTLNKLALVGSTTDVASSIDAGFTVWRSAKFGSSREDNNPALGGRLFGLKVVGARNGNTAGGPLTLFSVTFRNNMAAGDNASIVLSDAGSGASFTTAWKAGTTSNRGGYVLQVVSAAPLPTPVPVAGDANRDGVVSFADFAVLQNHYGQSGMGWDQGDFNGDGRVTFEDFSILQNHYGQSGGAAVSPSSAGAAGLPCGLLAIVGLALSLYLKDEWILDVESEQ